MLETKTIVISIAVILFILIMLSHTFLSSSSIEIGKNKEKNKKEKNEIKEDFPASPMNVLYSDSSGNLSSTSDLGVNYLTTSNNAQIGGALSSGAITSSGEIMSGDRKDIITQRGRIRFWNESSTDKSNHTIYNNYRNIDGEGVFDGIKMNVYDGLDIRTGNASGVTPTTMLSVRNGSVSTTGSFSAGSLTAGTTNVGALTAGTTNVGALTAGATTTGALSSSGEIMSGDKKDIVTQRGRLRFWNESSTDKSNHTIYNNYKNIDGEGVFDGMKMNVFDGLDIRTGNANGVTPTTTLSVRKGSVAVDGDLKVGGWKIRDSGGQLQFLYGDDVKYSFDPSGDMFRLKYYNMGTWYNGGSNYGRSEFRIAPRDTGNDGVFGPKYHPIHF